MLLRASFFAAATIAASPTLADAVTYRGTLGKSAIVVELTTPIEAAEGEIAGRYFYPRKGIDIPLDMVTAEPGELVMTEERPCTEAICDAAFQAGTFPDDLRGATWTLSSSDDGATITGTWQDDPTAKPLAVKLERVGSRPVDLYEPIRPDQLLTLPYQISDGTEDLSIENAPYDFLKGQWKLTEGEETRWGDVAFRYVSDPRTKFPFPRLTDLGGEDMSAVNARLASRHALISSYALECAGHQYLGMGWTPGTPEGESLGSFDEENVEVLALTPTLMSWLESGSTWCGGAYPNNHADYTNIDVRTGRDLDLSLLFEGSSQGEYSWEPGQKLIDFVRAKYEANTEADHSADADCGITDLIASNLAITFKQPDIVLFTLGGLPHVIMACGTDLYEAPVAELGELLKPAAADYFPTLKGQ
jgi:hypothetical protein